MTMKQFFLLFMLSSFALQSQNESEITYYSDKHGFKEISDGAFKKERVKINDSVVSETFSKVKNGQKIWLKFYLGKNPFGIWEYYDKKGKLEYSTDYNFVVKYGKFIPENAISFEDLDIEKGLDENTITIQKHIGRQFRYPEIAQQYGYQGRVEIQITIDENGDVGNLRILNEGHQSLDFECFKIMNSLKTLKPYQKDGKNVMVYYTLPINFKLN